MRHAMMVLVLGCLLIPGEAAAADNDSNRPVIARDPVPLAIDWAALRPVEPKRPAALPALYVSFAALQMADFYTTTSGLKNGASEANPLMAPFGGNTGAMLALKAGTTVGTIYLAERLWRRNRVAAIVVMAAVNGATAAVAAHNTRALGR